jgi:myo-inositol-1(or 4)-monophosphatase
MLDAITDVVRRVARDEVLPRFRLSKSSKKADGTLLSEVDGAAQDALVAALQAIAPGAVLGEEMPESIQAAAWASGDAGLWCIDPLDGTTNFVHGLPFFSISVAYLQGGRTTHGVVYHPLQDELFAAVRGGGATLNGSSLAVRSTSVPLNDALAAIEPKQLAPHLRVVLARRPPYYSMRNFGAGTLDWCYLAAGRFDVFLHGGQKLWDYAAGALILEEAGGVVETIEGAPFWTASPWQRSVIAAGHASTFTEWAAWVRAANGMPRNSA